MNNWAIYYNKILQCVMCNTYRGASCCTCGRPEQWTSAAPPTLSPTRSSSDKVKLSNAIFLFLNFYFYFFQFIFLFILIWSMYIVASCGFCLPSCCNMFCTPVQIHLILQPRFQRILLNKACIIVKYFFMGCRTYCDNLVNLCILIS